MQQVPTRAVPAQLLTVNLGGQACQILLQQLITGLFMTLTVNNQQPPIVAGVLCQNLNKIVRDLYLGFIGDFIFIDSANLDPTQADDPYYTGLGPSGRFGLFYLTAAEAGDS